MSIRSAALVGLARRQATAVATTLLTAQLVVITLTRVISARLQSTHSDTDRNPDADRDAGFTLVEWVIMLVVVAAAAATVATLIYNWVTNKAKGVTDNQQ